MALVQAIQLGACLSPCFGFPLSTHPQLHTCFLSCCQGPFLNSKSELNTLHGLPKCPNLLCRAINMSSSSTSLSWWPSLPSSYTNPFLGPQSHWGPFHCCRALVHSCPFCCPSSPPSLPSKTQTRNSLLQEDFPMSPPPGWVGGHLLDFRSLLLYI